MAKFVFNYKSPGTNAPRRQSPLPVIALAMAIPCGLVGTVAKRIAEFAGISVMFRTIELPLILVAHTLPIILGFYALVNAEMNRNPARARKAATAAVAISLSWVFLGVLLPQL
jgi:hypothetical protein